ncbi:aldo/keto reductase [Streptomyces sp. A0958]|uniref:aldo/keto reductase n=1 Tax=Streptomyces sp. A0958 TaxID=2563101 RepID=UPI001F0E0C4B|nr:aldo/keto reductase [Streptomyces sp. A0958]
MTASLANLGLDHVDLNLIHWPTPARDLYVKRYKALEKILADGRARAIGVSNFQIPTCGGSWSTPTSPRPAQGAVLGDEAVTSTAQANGVTPAQVVLRWHLQTGNIVIPKSVTPRPHPAEPRLLRIRAHRHRSGRSRRPRPGPAHRPDPDTLN